MKKKGKIVNSKLVKRFNSLSIQKKLKITLFTIVFLMLVLGVQSLLQLMSSFSMMSKMYNQNLQGIETIKEAQVNIISKGRGENAISLATYADNTAYYDTEVRDNTALFLDHIQKYKDNFANNANKKVLTNEIIEIWENKVLPISEKIVKARVEKKKEEVNVRTKNQNFVNQKQEEIKAYTKEQAIVVREIEKRIEKLVVSENNDAIALKNSMVTQRNRILVVTTFILLLAVGIAVLVQRYLYRTIGVPINHLAKEVKKIEEGDLLGEMVEAQNQDEIGELYQSFGAMKKSLQEIIVSVKTAAMEAKGQSHELMASSQHAVSTTNQVSQAMEQLAVGANQQAIDVEGISFKVNEISNRINQVVKNIEKANVTSFQVSTTSKLGAVQAEEAIAKIEKVKETSNEVKLVMNNLEKEMKRIGQMGNLIATISSKTNILSINAAIEAARAGEAGKGFSVVAEEVRKLAEQSSVSAKEIMQVIKELQSEVQVATDVIQSGQLAVSEGVEVVYRSGEAFKGIQTNVEDIALQISDILQTANDIEKGTLVMAEAIESISAIAEETAATGEEVLATTEQQGSATEEVTQAATRLATLANNLSTAIEVFKV